MLFIKHPISAKLNHMEKSQNFINEVQLEFQKKLFSTNKISCSENVAELSRKIFKATNSCLELKEYFFVIMLNRANEVIGYTKLGEGGISGALVDLRLAFATAIKCLASGIILLHNHPSANLKPSYQDKCLTTKFIEAGKILDIQVLDHVILTIDGYYSFTDEGILL
jgi:DNA repair protein RadC